MVPWSTGIPKPIATPSKTNRTRRFVALGKRERLFRNIESPLPPLPFFRVIGDFFEERANKLRPLSPLAPGLVW